MKSLFFIAVILLLVHNIADAQEFTDSNLPIVIINTDGGVSIHDNPRIMADMKIIYRGEGERNYISDQNNPDYLNYDGRIDIEIRGSSSTVSDKKQYGLTTRQEDGVTNNNVSLLGMPEENDWILNGMVFDPALMRDFLCFNLSRQIGEYASRTAYCEMIINGEYMGLYLLEEKIKADKNRVDVIKITAEDLDFPDVTGGYITKCDKTTGGDPVAWTMNNFFGNVDFIHALPKPESVQSAQHNYIRSYFFRLDSIANTKDNSPVTGYPSLIDIPSFINYMIIAELSSNADSYQFSTYFHKDRNGKLRAGPIWDSDLTFDNDLYFWGFDRSKPDVWQFDNSDNVGARFWKNLFYTNMYRCYLSKRWNELTAPGQPLNPDTLNSYINRTVSYISEAVVREDLKWGNIGSHENEVAKIKNYLDARYPWMTDTLGPYSECNNVVVPPLVITRIMYHPDSSLIYADREDMEFIEITNTGYQIVDLTGIYFMGTGLVYQFPAGAKANPGEKIFLAGKSSVFKSIYGIRPFGQFTRSLSNSSERLLLADCFGNIIDDVTYNDTLPWPDADGNGYYLELIDPNLDNNLGENWIAVFDNSLDVRDVYTPENIKVFPNPVSDFLNIETITEIISVRLYDLAGRLITSDEHVYNANHRINMTNLPAGIYLVRVNISGQTITYRIIKM